MHFAFTRFFTLLMVLVVLSEVGASAQATVDSLPTPVLTRPETNSLKDSVTKVIPVKKQSPATKKDVAIIQSDSVVDKAYSRAMAAYYYALERKNLSDAATLDSLTLYNNWALQNRKAVITTQQVYAKIIFVLVIIIVLSGLAFSALQFRNALKNSKKKGTVSDTTLKATLGGIEVSSSILGVIILTLSIVFFYLYLTMVYPVVLVK